MARRSSTTALPNSYFSAYDRPEHSAGRVEWLDRNNYPNRSFGIGRGLNVNSAIGRANSSVGYVGRRSDYRRSDYRSGNRHGERRHHSRHGFGHGRRDGNDFFGRVGSFALGVGVGRHFNRHDHHDYGRWPYYLGVRNHYRHGLSSYYSPQRYSYYSPYYTSFGFSWGYPWYGSSWGYPRYDASDSYYDYDATYVTNNYYDSAQGGVSASVSTPGTGMSTAPVAGIVAPSATSGSVSHARNGVQAFRQGDYATARRELVRAILAAPDDAELIMLYGYAHFATGDYLVAALALRRATSADPSLIERPIDVAALYADRAEFQMHLDRLDAHLAADAKDIDARYLAGFMRYAAGEPDTAGPYFAECMAAAPDDLVYFIMRDAALRASVAQQAAQRASDDANSDVEIVEMVPVPPGEQPRQRTEPRP